MHSKFEKNKLHVKQITCFFFFFPLNYLMDHIFVAGVIHFPVKENYTYLFLRETQNSVTLTYDLFFYLKMEDWTIQPY